MHSLKKNYITMFLIERTYISTQLSEEGIHFYIFREVQYLYII